MTRLIARFCACTAVFAALTVCADEDETDTASGDKKPAAAEGRKDESADKKGEAAEGVELPAPAPAKNPFYQLVRLARIDAGRVEVRKPLSEKWEIAEDGRLYPNGAAFRLSRANPEDEHSPVPVAAFEFGEGCRLFVTNDAEFATREIEIGSKTRTLIPRHGFFHFDLPRTLPAGAMQVAAPYFLLKDLAGESTIEYMPNADGDEAVVCVLTGQMALEGAHYSVAKMCAANQVRIRTTQDDLFTSLRCESGTYVAKLDQGTVMEKDFVAGTSKEVVKTLDFELSPKCAVKIWRTRPHAGGRMVVNVMTFTAGGDMQNHRTFAEKRYNVNSGELVIKPGEAAAAQAAAEAAAAEAAAEAASNEEKSSDGSASNEGNKKENEEKTEE